MRRVLLLLVPLVAGCGGSSSMSEDELRSELQTLRSLVSETQLFREVLIAGHASRTFAQGHAEYLRKMTEEHVKKLESARPAPGMETALAQAREAAHTVERMVDILATQVR
jgi:hypothetical protein